MFEIDGESLSYVAEEYDIEFDIVKEYAILISNLPFVWDTDSYNNLIKNCVIRLSNDRNISKKEILTNAIFDTLTMEIDVDEVNLVINNMLKNKGVSL